MKLFFIRFLIFIGIWTLMMIHTSGDIFLSIFMLTASLICFFLLSLHHTPIFLYIILSSILFIHGWIVHDVFFTSLLIILITVIALFKLPNRSMYYLLGFHAILTSMLAVLQNENLLTLLLITSYVMLFLLLILNMTELNEKKDLYEQLLIEYRQLKRINVSTEEIAKAEERTRIARDIHDSVGHQLTALMMKLEMLHIEEPNENYAKLKEMVTKSLQDTREAVRTLQESETKGITAVVQLIRKLEAESQLLIQFTLKEGVLSIPLSNQHGIVLYRVIQEALTNVMRHSPSKQVSVTIGRSAVNSVSFKIENAIHREKKFELGFGLKNMKARVLEVGGKIDIYQTNDRFIVQGMLPSEKQTDRSET